MVVGVNAGLILFQILSYDELFLIGHSFGCLAIMNAELIDVKKIIYWDPTCGFKSLEDKGLEYNKEMGKYILHWGWESIVSRELVEEWMETNDVKKYAERLRGDYSFIFSGRERFENGKDYVDGHEFVIIGGASHRFVEEGTLNKLFEETLKLLES